MGKPRTPKSKAWAAFSRYIRTRDCLNTTGLAFVGICVTCDRRFHIRALQAGHCLPGRSNAKLFDEELVHAQCVFCNMHRHGESKKYRAKMAAKYGVERFEQMIADRKKAVKYLDYEAIEVKYKAKLKELSSDLDRWSIQWIIKHGGVDIDPEGGDAYDLNG